MNYVRCIHNQAYLHVPDEAVNGALTDLTIGAVYKVLPTSSQARDTGLLRIVDNSGEDYLYPASYFQPLDWHTSLAEGGWACRIDPVPRPTHQGHSTRRSFGRTHFYGCFGASMD
jgi:hypothetical protein